MTSAEHQRFFDGLCVQAFQILQNASRYARQTGLSDIDIAKADAAAGLAGATFHKISIHGADAADYEDVEKDLHHIARKVQPLIENIGIAARLNSYGPFDDSVFMDTFERGLEDALGELHCARDRAVERMEAAE